MMVAKKDEGSEHSRIAARRIVSPGRRDPMVFPAHPRFILALLAPVLLTATLSCGRPDDRSQPKDKVMRHGEDVLASGGAPSVPDSVPGDAIVAGGDVRFSGATGGDYLGAGGKQVISGRIHGSLRSAGGEVHVMAAVDRNATVAGGKVVLDSTAAIGRNAYLVGGDVQIDGAVREGLLASGGRVTLNGVVGRDVQINGGELRIGPRAQIAGNLRYRVPAKNVHIDPAARISGTVTALHVSRPWGPGRWHLLWILGFLVVGAVIVALFPRFAAEAAEILLQRPGWSGLVGLGWIILVPIAICIAAITIIGIPLALVTTAAYIVLLYLGRTTIAVWLGRRVLGARALAGRQGVLVNFLVGGLILLIVGIIPVIGSWLMVIATVLGLGTILLRAKAMREERSA